MIYGTVKRHAPPMPAERDLICDLANLLLESEPDQTDLASLAKHFAYSDTQFRRICVRVLGEPVGSFERRLRLERAAGRLSFERVTVAAIAYEAGYATPEAFCKAFSAYFGCCPSCYRRINSSAECAMPAYIATSPSCGVLPKAATIHLPAGQRTTVIYDGLVLLAKILPTGVIEWLPRSIVSPTNLAVPRRVAV